MYGPRLNRLFRYLSGGAISLLASLAVAQTSPLFTAVSKPMPWIDAIPSASGYTFNGLGRMVPNDIDSFRIVHGSPGWLDATASTSLPAKAGGAAVNVTARIDKLAAAKAIGSFAYKVASPIATILAVKQLMDELGITSRFNDQTKRNEFVNPNGSCQAVCTGSSGNGQLPTDPAFSATSICYGSSHAAFEGMRYGSFVGYWCMTEKSTAEVLYTQQQLADKIASKSGWPTSSSLAPALKLAIKSGEIPESTGQSVDGPASKEISRSVTNIPATANKPASTITSTTSNNYTYSGPNVSVSTTTSNVTTNNAGDIIDSSTTTTTEATNPEPPTAEDPCIKNPDRVGCSTLDTPEELTPRETKNVAFAVDAITWGAAASCPPPWVINVPTISKSFSVKYDPFCDIASRVRPFILAGAAFVAMMIVMAGIKT